MDKLLKMYSLSRLNQEEIENMNRLNISNEIEIVIIKKRKTSPQTKASQLNSTKHLEKN